VRAHFVVHLMVEAGTTEQGEEAAVRRHRGSDGLNHRDTEHTEERNCAGRSKAALHLLISVPSVSPW
jgi:hypothetical protein